MEIQLLGYEILNSGDTTLDAHNYDGKGSHKSIEEGKAIITSYGNLYGVIYDVDTVYQERKVFGMFWVNPLTVPYDISTENTSFAIFILHLTFHTNTSSPFCLPTCISRLQAAPCKVQLKKPKATGHWA